MSNGLKTLCGCVLSAVFGCAVGAGVTYIIQSRKFQQRMDDEVKNLKKRSEPSLGERGEVVEKREEENVNKDFKQTVEYDKIVNEIIEKMPEEKKREIERSGIYQITKAEYDSAEHWYAKRELNYYIDDGILTESSTDEPVEPYILGNDVDLESAFNNDVDGNLTLYLRNNDLLVIYKITGIIA